MSKFQTVTRELNERGEALFSRFKTIQKDLTELSATILRAENALREREQAQREKLEQEKLIQEAIQEQEVKTEAPATVVPDTVTPVADIPKTETEEPAKKQKVTAKLIEETAEVAKEQAPPPRPSETTVTVKQEPAPVADTAADKQNILKAETPVQVPTAVRPPQTPQIQRPRTPIQQGPRIIRPPDPNRVIRPPQPQEQFRRPVDAAPRPQQGAPAGFRRPQSQSAITDVGGRPQQPQRPFRPGVPSGNMGNRPPAPGRNINTMISTSLAPTVQKEKVSNYDPNKKLHSRDAIEADKRAKSKRDIIRGANIEELDNGKFRSMKRKKEVYKKPEFIIIDKAVITTEMVPVKDLAEKIGKPAADIVKKLFLLGIKATVNHEIDFDTAALVADDFGVQLEHKMDKTYEEVLQDIAQVDHSQENIEERPPVVVVMGHVDHGKTSLLDAIRSANVTASEAGGITQHIGAYMVTLKGKKITFLDTPGHEAFTAMRARGAKATDIAVLVVAADDGIMPQTIEAIHHAKAAEVPIIVAINKMDKPSAEPDRIMQQLTEYGLVAEAWGGDTIIAQVSALTHQGVDNLLEMILLSAEVLQLRADSTREAKGIIIESKLDKGRGPVATVLVQNGTLRVGDNIVAGTTFGRVRLMNDDKGNRITEAGPSVPVEVIGFNDVPDAGDIINVVDEKLTKQVAEERKNKLKAEKAKTIAKVNLEDIFNKISQGEVKDLNLIIKADVQGSVEAVKQALEKLGNEEVRVRTIHSGAGAITESDVMLAATSGAIVIGFNVRPDTKGREAAERENVDVRLYRIIYNAIEDVEKALKGMLKPEFKETVLGHAQVRSIFKVSNVGTIAGCYITDGKVLRNAKVRLLRDSIVVHEGELSSLKRFKDDAKEVQSGYECGISLSGYNDIKEMDVIEAFIIEEVKR